MSSSNLSISRDLSKNQNFDENIQKDFNIKDNKGFDLLSRLQQMNFDDNKIKLYNSKPFDYQYCYYDEKILRRASFKIQRHLLNKKNTALICKRGRLLGSGGLFNHVSVTSTITDKNFLADQSYLFPIYLYSSTSEIFANEEKSSNINSNIIKELEKRLGVKFNDGDEPTTFSSENILDYLFAILNSPSYREKYKEFLKIDFPRVPYPKDKETFWKLVELGSQIRQIHLLESPKVEEYITAYPKDGDNTITTKIAKKDWKLFDPKKQLGRIWINEEQYFDNIPLTAWEFYIGGYQPAQKWLKDRKGRTLNFDDILHYQKIIVALHETDRLMKEIDKIEIE